MVIATGTYIDEELARLRAPARDAADLAAVLRAPNIGAFDVTVLRDRSAHELRIGVQDFLHARTAGDLLVVYISCHGVLDVRSRLYFAAADTRKTHLASTGIESQWLLDRLDECKARRQVLVLDCCFSGAFAAGAKGEAELTSQLVSNGRGRVVLTASRAREYSFEGLALPGANHEKPGSVFTTGLVEGLRTGNADVDGDGLISVEDAYDYAYTYVQDNHAAQTPQRWTYGAEGRIWLAHNPTGRTVTEPSSGPPDRTVETPRSSVPHHPFSISEPVAADARRPVTQFRPTSGRSRATIEDVIFSPDDRLLAIIDSDRVVHLWDTNSDRPHVQPLDGPRGEVTSLVFSPDGRMLAAARSDETVRLWHIDTGTPIGRPVAGSRPVFSPDGRVLATADKSRVHLWNAREGHEIGAALAAHTAQVYAMAFNPDGTILASASRDTTIRLWGVADGKLIGVLDGHAYGVNAAVFSPDGRVLATASADRTVRLWDVADRRQTHELIGHDNITDSVAFSPDGQLLASCGGSTVRLWSADSGLPVGTPLSTAGSARSVEFTQDGGTVISRDADRNVTGLWNPATGRPYSVLLHGLPRAVAVSRDGRWLAAASRDTVRIWQAVDTRAAWRPANPDTQVKKYRPTGLQQFVTALGGVLLAAASVAFSVIACTNAFGVHNDISQMVGSAVVTIAGIYWALRPLGVATGALTLTPHGARIRTWRIETIPWNSVTAVMAAPRTRSTGTASRTNVLLFVADGRGAESWAPMQYPLLPDSRFDEKMCDIQQWAEYFGGPVIW